MPTFYNYRENGVTYSFDDVFVPADAFRQGNLWVWGLNSYGQLGINDAVSRSTPVTTFVGASNWKTVSRSAAIKTDGTLWIWGLNSYGKLGNNTTTNRSTPVTTFAGGTNWKQVASASHTAAIKTDGTLWTWGLNSSGQLGDTTTTNRLTPVTTFAGGTNWKQVACGNAHTAAVKTDGTLWVWGANGSGQLGINASVNRTAPVTTFAGGTNWKQVSGGNNHTVAIKTDGTLWTWGLNSSGQLGDNTLISRSTPVTTFAGGTNWKQSACGDESSAAIKTDGTLWCWGNNNYGALGINSFVVNICTPVTISTGGTNWKQVSLSGYTGGAITTGGALYMWGSNSIAGGSGSLGNNSATIRVVAPVFLGTNNWKEISVSFNSTAVTYIDDYL